MAFNCIFIVEYQPHRESGCVIFRYENELGLLGRKHSDDEHYVLIKFARRTSYFQLFQLSSLYSKKSRVALNLPGKIQFNNDYNEKRLGCSANYIFNWYAMKADYIL